MGGVTNQNMYSSLQKYKKLYIVASCWTIIGIDSRGTNPRTLNFLSTVTLVKWNVCW